MPLFGSSGIRGPYPEAVDETLLLRLGRAVGSLHAPVLLGRDVRLSGPVLSEAFVAGATAAGADVHDAGVVPTPTVAHLAAAFECGAVVTASHNPPGDNGLKLWDPSGMAFDAERREAVEAALADLPPHAPWDAVGTRHAYDGALRAHEEKILRALQEARVRVALDCGNGATSLLAPRLLRRLGCEVVTLHCQPDGRFPGRGPEPTEEALAGLGSLVRSAGCQLGVAHDGDGDRMVALDGTGDPIPPEALLILFARALGARRVVTPVDSSMVLEDVLGADAVVRCRVGDVYVAERLRDTEADLGGEISGTWIFPGFALCPDGPYAAALLCTLLQEGTLGDWLDDIPRYPVVRDSLPYDPGIDVASKLEELLSDVDAADVLRLDGWRFDLDDGWALVRPSGTEPRIRLTVEARDEARAREIYASFHARLSEGIP